MKKAFLLLTLCLIATLVPAQDRSAGLKRLDFGDRDDARHISRTIVRNVNRDIYRDINREIRSNIYRDVQVGVGRGHRYWMGERYNVSYYGVRDSRHQIRDEVRREIRQVRDEVRREIRSAFRFWRD